MKLSINLIVLDPTLQPRVLMDQDVIDEYADAMREGKTFPAVVVFRDDDVFWLADGFHRVNAAKLAGLSEVDADVHQGTKRDALLFAVQANEEHGLRRTQADRRKAVLALLADPGYTKMSNRELGRLCKVNDKTVAKYRNESSADFRTSLVHSPEVIDFFGGRLWLTHWVYNKVAEILPDEYNDLRQVVVPEVRRAVHKFKELGIEEIAGPTRIWGRGEDKIIELATIDGFIWWALVIDLRGTCEGEDGRGYTNSDVVRGFDQIIRWLYVNAGPSFLPSRMATLFIGEPPGKTEHYWDNAALGHSPTLPKHGEGLERWEVDEAEP